MGRWSYSDRWTVEDCHSITTKFLKEYKYFDGGVHWGGMNWRRAGEIVGSIRFCVSIEAGNEYIRFKYTQTNRITGEKADLDYIVHLTWTPCYFGGRRWWFICPLTLDGNACKRRVGSLYIANGRYFGCRHCNNLTYTSCRESHKFDRLFRNLGMTEKQARELDIWGM